MIKKQSGMYKKLIAASLIGFVLFGCGETNTVEDNYTKGEEPVKVDDDIKTTDMPVEEIVALLNSVPPPLELAVLMKAEGGEYSNGPLNPTTNAKKYNTSYKRALNLGVYGADLGYANIYSQTQDAIDYLTTVKGLAEDLSIGQFFDFETIKEMANSGDNLTELLNLTTKNYEKMNNHLKEKKRVNESVLMMTGGWVEGLHVACYVAKDHDSQALRERIGEQKITLEQIMLLLGMYGNDPDISKLRDDMKKLESAFSKVTIEQKEGETVTKTDEFGLEYTETETVTTITLTPEVLVEIAAAAEQVRAKMIN